MSPQALSADLEAHFPAYGRVERRLRSGGPTAPPGGTDPPLPLLRDKWERLSAALRDRKVGGELCGGGASMGHLWGGDLWGGGLWGGELWGWDLWGCALWGGAVGLCSRGRR